MAFDRTKLAAGFGGGNTFQVFTYTSDVDDKATIAPDTYWEDENGKLMDNFFKNGDVIYFTSADNDMGIKFWYNIEG